MPSRSRPSSRPFQTRSRPVPWNPRAVSIHSHVAQEEKTGLCIQRRIIWFILSHNYMKWLSWFKALRSRHAEKTFYILLRKWSFQTSGSPRNDPDPFIDPWPYRHIFKIDIAMQSCTWRRCGSITSWPIICVLSSHLSQCQDVLYGWRTFEQGWPLTSDHTDIVTVVSW